MTVRDAAAEMEWSHHTWYRLERGEAPLRLIDAKAVCELLGADPDWTDVVLFLARESKAQGWWQAYGSAVPEWFDLYLGMEAAAERLRQYEPMLIPGLLQQASYAEAIYRTRPGVTDDHVRRAVDVRMKRQDLLSRKRPDPPMLDVIVDEAVLRRRIPDAVAWRAQLAHLLDVSQRKRFSLRVVPATTGPHRVFIAGAFVILDFPPIPRVKRKEPTTVYSESLTGALYLELEEEVAQYEQAWSQLETIALDTPQSRDLINKIIEEAR